MHHPVKSPSTLRHRLLFYDLAMLRGVTGFVITPNKTGEILQSNYPNRP